MAIETVPTSQDPKMPVITAEASRMIDRNEKPKRELTAGSRSWKLSTPIAHSRSSGPTSTGSCSLHAQTPVLTDATRTSAR